METEALLKEFDFFRYKILDTAELPFSPEVTERCRENYCGRYGTCWTCAPGAGTTEELKKSVMKFSKAAVLVCEYELDSSDTEGKKEAAKETQGLLRELVEELRETKEEFLALGCEGCRICTKCNYPGTACRFPERAIRCVHACGIDTKELGTMTGLTEEKSGCFSCVCMILF